MNWKAAKVATLACLMYLAGVAVVVGMTIISEWRVLSHTPWKPGAVIFLVGLPVIWLGTYARRLER